MKKLSFIIVIVCACFMLSSCANENNPIIDIINKQIEIVDEVDDLIDDNLQEEDDDTYGYENIQDCLAKNPSRYSYSVAGTLENSFYWIVYIEDDTVKMQIFDNGMTFEKDEIGIIAIHSKSYDSCDFPWRYYSNIIQEVIFGIEGQEFDVNFPLNTFFSYSSTLEKVTFLNCTSNSENLTSMDNMFECCYELKSVDFINCDFSSINSINSMFLYCDNLNRCDLRAFDLCENLNCKDMFYCDDKNINIISNNEAIVKYYEDYVMTGDLISRINNAVLLFNNVYESIDNIQFIDATNYEYNPFRYKEESDVKWCVYADQNNVIRLKISNGDVLPVNDGENCYRIIEANAYNYDNILQGWKKYSNLINEVLVIQDNSVGNFDCSMNGWFMEMNNLNNIALNDLYVEDEFYGASLFCGCSSLQEIHLNNCYFNDIVETTGMFDGCDSLTSIFLDSEDIFDKIQDTSKLLHFLQSGVKIRNKNGDDVTHIVFHAYAARKIDPYNQGYSCYYNKYNSISDVEFMHFDKNEQGQNVLPYENQGDLFWYIVAVDNDVYLVINSWYETVPQFENCRLIDCDSECLFSVSQRWKEYGNLVNYVIINSDNNNSFGCSLDGWFENMEALEDVCLNNLRFDHPSSMIDTFQNCTSLRTVRYTACYFSGIYDISRCFYGCVSLYSINMFNYGAGGSGFGEFWGLYSEDAFYQADNLTSSRISDSALKEAYTNGLSFEW